jgi:hypothetical protein
MAGINHVIRWEGSGRPKPPLVARFFGHQELGHLPMGIAQGRDCTVEIKVRRGYCEESGLSARFSFTRRTIAAPAAMK